MMGFAVLLAKELKEQLRTYRLPIVAIVFLTLGMSSPVMARYLPDLIRALGGDQAAKMVEAFGTPTVNDGVDQILKNLSQFGIHTAILLAMGSVATEKATGTAGMVLTKPASRASFLAAKLAAISINLGIAVAAGCAFGYAYSWLMFDRWLPGLGFTAMAVLLWLTLVFYAALTFLGSVLTRSAMAAAGLGFVFFIITGVISVVPVLGDYIPQALGKPARALAIGADPGVFWGPLLASIAMIVLLYVASWLSFRRQEL